MDDEYVWYDRLHYNEPKPMDTESAKRWAGEPNTYDGPCSEPDGNEIVDKGMTAHEVMIEATGACPWCGEEGI